MAGQNENQQGGVSRQEATMNVTGSHGEVNLFRHVLNPRRRFTCNDPRRQAANKEVSFGRSIDELRLCQEPAGKIWYLARVCIGPRSSEPWRLTRCSSKVAAHSKVSL